LLESVKAELRQRGVWNRTLEQRIKEFERLCIQEIRLEFLRATIVDYLETVAPLDFFTAPASFSGLTHPYWQVSLGGILLNTVECCIGIDRKMRIYTALTDAKGNPASHDRDIIYAATILSDTFKNEDAKKRWQEYSHHRTATTKWREVAGRHNLPADLTESIADAIFWHLGRFTSEWSEGADPRTHLSIHAFITHELDMDFSNRNLALVFDRKGMEESMPASESPEAFLEKEFDSSSDYFSHIESKLLNIVTFYVTLIVAVIAGMYHVATSETFAKMTFWAVKGPRAFFMGLAALAFSLIGVFLLGMYTELRTRKILMLEEMARIREHYIHSARAQGKEIGNAITMVSGVVNCPPFLRRPSEDWYTILLMTFVSAISLAFGVAAGFYAFAPNWFRGTLRGQMILFVLGLAILVLVAFLQFRWVTTFCFIMDCRREQKYGRPQYALLPKHPSAFPLGLGLIDRLAAGIEKHERKRISDVLNSSSTHS